jgi:hypothetical protein
LEEGWIRGEGLGISIVWLAGRIRMAGGKDKEGMEGSLP